MLCETYVFEFDGPFKRNRDLITKTASHQYLRPHKNKPAPQLSTSTQQPCHTANTRLRPPPPLRPRKISLAAPIKLRRLQQGKLPHPSSIGETIQPRERVPNLDHSRLLSASVSPPLSWMHLRAGPLVYRRSSAAGSIRKRRGSRRCRLQLGRTHRPRCRASPCRMCSSKLLGRGVVPLPGVRTSRDRGQGRGAWRYIRA